MINHNQQETYAYDADPWMGILSADVFAVHFNYHFVKCKIPRQLVFGRYMILPIAHIKNWGYIGQLK